MQVSDLVFLQARTGVRQQAPAAPQADQLVEVYALPLQVHDPV